MHSVTDPLKSTKTPAHSDANESGGSESYTKDAVDVETEQNVTTTTTRGDLTESDSTKAGITKRGKSERTFFKRVKPKKPFTVANQIRRTLLSSWINVLLISAPVGTAVNFIKSVDRIAVFVINFIAIIPLAAAMQLSSSWPSSRSRIASLPLCRLHLPALSSLTF